MKKLIILGAAGRDFHNFNVAFRNNNDFQVIAFTATQIPDIANRCYPAELAGPLYPNGIPIFEEKNLERLIAEHKVDAVVFSYSDISHANLMHLASRVVASKGAYAGVMDLVLASSRSMPDFEAAARSFEAVDDARLAELEAVCPTAVPMRAIKAFVLAKSNQA